MEMNGLISTSVEMNTENFRKNCAIPPPETYNSTLGFTLAVPEWEAAVTATVLSLITTLTIVGNILVILSVFKHKPLRTAQNFFIVSLAVADLTVALFVLPFNIVYTILNRWIFGSFFCKFWLTCDIMCCTASILNLCAIALDRYWAITDPIDYAQKRNLNWVLKIIAAVWILSAIISSPPLAGWNNWPEMFDAETPCRLTDEQGYVVYSSLGSFYIPLFIMAVVYVEIYVATRRRLRRRSRAAKMSMIRLRQTQPEPKSPSFDVASISTETSTKVQEPEILKKHKSKVERSVEEDSVTDSHETASSVTDKTRSSTSEANIKELQTQSSFTIQEEYPVYQFIEDRHRISLSKERRAARTMGVIMGAFVFCWLPFFLMYVIEPFCVICCPSRKLVSFITWLGYVNSAINPFIYTIFNMDFRKAFKKLLHLN